MSPGSLFPEPMARGIRRGSASGGVRTLSALIVVNTKAAPSSWRPLFDGDEALAIDAFVRQIAEALRDPHPDWLANPWVVAGSESANRRYRASLTGGWPGVALLHGYCFLSGGGAEDRSSAQALLDRAMAVVADTPSEPSLSDGFTGVAWAMQHLLRVLAIPTDDDPVAAADEILEIMLSRGAARHYDLISGLVGWGVYFIERLPGPRGRACLEYVVDGLVATAEHIQGQTTWYTPPEWLHAQEREEAPGGYYSLGMAHGVAGVLAMLGAAYAAGLEDDRIPPLIESSASWLLEQERPVQAAWRFGTWVEPGKPPTPSRFAWCHGDPGVAVGLMGAARGIGHQELLSRALAIARLASDTTREHPDVLDAGLCHGTAGLGHMFNRLYQATGEELFADAARHWFRKTLALRKPGLGIAGLQTFRGNLSSTHPWAGDAGFLTGAAGTALALLASVSTVDPQWDRIILTSIPAGPVSRGR